MKTFDLTALQKRDLYKTLYDKKGTFFADMDKIELLLNEVDALINERQDLALLNIHYRLDQKIKAKVKYVRNLIKLLDQKIKDSQKKVDFPGFFYKPGENAWSTEFKLKAAAGDLSEYFYQAKIFLAEVEELLDMDNLTDELVASKNQHLLAIMQSLLPSGQSIASLMIPQSLAEMEKHPEVKEKLTKEESDAIVEQNAKSLTDYLYKSENSVAVNMLNGMRGDYIRKLSQFEALYHKYREVKAALQEAQEEKQVLLQTMEENTLTSNHRIDELTQTLKQQDGELLQKNTKLHQKDNLIDQKNVIIDRLEGTISAQKQCIANQTEELILLKDQSIERLNKTKSSSSPHQQSDMNSRSDIRFFASSEPPDNASMEAKNKTVFSWFGLRSKHG